jgi:MarR-like DNA-binding transcriptional regulator SgrR of sgrS sRNA
MVLERGQDFLLSTIDEGTLCSPVKVKEILEALGGEVDCQSKLVKAIQDEASCSSRSARTFIHRAIQMKEILEIESGQGRAKKYVTFD